MKKIKYIVSGLLISLGVWSCDFLDLDAQDFVQPKNFYNTPEDFNMALMGVYQVMANASLYGNNIPGRLGLMADLGYSTFVNGKNTVAEYNVVASDANVRNYWRQFYLGIGRANMLLESAATLDPDKEIAGLDEIIGQTRFLRAYYYFMLVIRFGDIPLVLITPDSDLSEESTLIPQTPAQDVYRWIIDEMREAAPLVKTAQQAGYGGLVNQSAVYGILSRVCLYAAGKPYEMEGMYALSASFARRVIDTGFHELNSSFDNVFYNLVRDVYDVKECIFEVEFWGDGTGIYGAVDSSIPINMGVAHDPTPPSPTGYISGGVRCNDVTIELFDHENDTRFARTVNQFRYNSAGEYVTPVTAATSNLDRFCVKFRRSEEVNQDPGKSRYATPCNWPVLRYAEVLLTYAEAVACDPENNSPMDLEMAYECANMVRRRGYGVPVGTASVDFDFPALSKEHLAQEIRDERARELAFEMLRKDDLIRWGIFYEQMKYMGRMVPPSPLGSFYAYARRYYGNVQRRDVLWPIPSYELVVNRKLKQNPGW